MSVCIHCGLTEDQHHSFDAKPTPAGCVCDPGTWGDVIDAICEEYHGDGRIYCARCEHDPGCHRGAKAGRRGRQR